MAVYNNTPVNQEYIKLRWQEPYVSSGLNRKTFGVFLKGVYAGFKIEPQGLRGLRVGPGNVNGGLGHEETLGWSIAVHQSPTGHATTISIIPGADQYLYLDATGCEGQRVFCVLDVNYQIGATTTANLKLVDSAQIVANPSYVVLGHIDVPSIAEVPIDLANIGYDDATHPRLTPESTPTRAGLMPPSIWGRLDESFPWQTLLLAEVDPANNKAIRILPGQKVVNSRRVYAYIQPAVPSKFPRNASGAYNGGPLDNQGTILNLQTGVIGGAHQVAGNLSFTVPAVIGQANKFQVGSIGIDPQDRLIVVFGAVQATQAAALDPLNVPSVGGSNLPLATFLLKTDGSGALIGLVPSDVADARPLLNAGSAGGGGSPEFEIEAGEELLSGDVVSIGIDGKAYKVDARSVAALGVPAGLCVRPAGLGGAALVQSSGPATLTGLTPGASYYVNPAVPGGLTTVKPSEPYMLKDGVKLPVWTVFVGKAVSPTVLNLQIVTPVETFKPISNLNFSVSGPYYVGGPQEGLLIDRTPGVCSIGSVTLQAQYAGSSGVLDIDLKYKNSSSVWVSIFDGARPSLSFSTGNFAKVVVPVMKKIEHEGTLRLDVISVQDGGEGFNVIIEVGQGPAA